MVLLPPSNPSGTLLLGLAQWGKQGSSTKLSCSRFSDRVDSSFPPSLAPPPHTRRRSAWVNGSRSAATSLCDPLSSLQPGAPIYNDSLDSRRPTHRAQCPALTNSSSPAQKEILISKAAQGCHPGSPARLLPPLRLPRISWFLTIALDF